MYISNMANAETKPQINTPAPEEQDASAKYTALMEQLGIFYERFLTGKLFHIPFLQGKNSERPLTPQKPVNR